MLPNIFDAEVTNQLINRVHQLTPQTQPRWGKMSVAQMLAHCNVSYEMVFEDKHPRPNKLMRWIITLLAKSTVTGEKPYKRNLRTAPQFLVGNHQNFEAEKQRLIAYLQKTQQLGEGWFNGRESHSFGKLTVQEWSNLFYKHLDHHLQQFGA